MKSEQHTKLILKATKKTPHLLPLSHSDTRGLCFMCGNCGRDL